MHRAFLKVVEGFLVKEGLFLTETLLEELALVSELDDGLCVGVKRSDRGSHAAGEGSPGHTEKRHKKPFHLIQQKTENSIKTYMSINISFGIREINPVHKIRKVLG